MKKKLLFLSFCLKQSVLRAQFTLLLLSLFCVTSSFAQFRLVKDINTKSDPSFNEFSRLTDLNGTLYYISRGRELWKSNGTLAGTIKVKDFASVTLLANVNGVLYLAANDGTSGNELWKSNGTPGGTIKVKDIRAGAGSSDPNSFMAVGSQVYFIASDAAGKEVWKTNGTTAGTLRVKDIMKGAGHSNPSNLTSFNNKLYFVANNGTNGYELWESNGTDVGTLVVKDIFPGSTSSAPNFLTVSGGSLYFAARDPAAGQEVFKSDGTGAGTVLLKDIRAGATGSFPRTLIDVDGTLFTVANDGVNGYEFWKSDGTPGGTVIIDGLLSGTNGGNTFLYLSSMRSFQGKLYFQSGRPIYRTDGTLEGTEVVASTEYFYVGVKLVDLNNALFFINTGVELWKIEGATSSLVKDMDPSTDIGIGAGGYELIRSGNRLFFVVEDIAAGTFGLWRSDGTTAGTVKIKDGASVTESSFPSFLTSLNGAVYFGATNGTNDALWKSNGTDAGTVQVKDFGLVNISNIITVGSALYFTRGFSEVWKSDGTPVGTILLGSGLNPAGLIDVNGTLFFRGRDGSAGDELWKSNGTVAGTVRIKDIEPGNVSSFPAPLANVNGTLFFYATTTATSRELWKSDGTAAGTVLVKDINPSGGTSIESGVAMNNQFFFVVNDFVHGYELWKSDGTDAGTVMIKDIRLNDTNLQQPTVVDITGLTVLNGVLYFTAIDDASGWALWKSDGTPAGTVKVKDFHPGLEHINILESINNELFMLVSDAGFNNFALWKSNGTTAGTVRVKLLTSGDPRSFGVGGSEVMNGVLYFSAEPRRVWRTDGTDCGTYTVDYENPFDFVSLPLELTAAGSTLFFSGTATTVGAELFKLDEADVPGSPCLLASAPSAHDTSLAKEVSEEDESETIVSQYPNPFANEFTLWVDGPDDASYQASIIHLNGMTLEEHKDMKYNVGYSVGRGLSSGIYLLKVQTNSGVKTKRIVKVD